MRSAPNAQLPISNIAESDLHEYAASAPNSGLKHHPKAARPRSDASQPQSSKWPSSRWSRGTASANGTSFMPDKGQNRNRKSKYSRSRIMNELKDQDQWPLKKEKYSQNSTRRNNVSSSSKRNVESKIAAIVRGAQAHTLYDYHPLIENVPTARNYIAMTRDHDQVLFGKFDQYQKPEERKKFQNHPKVLSASVTMSTEELTEKINELLEKIILAKRKNNDSSETERIDVQRIGQGAFGRVFSMKTHEALPCIVNWLRKYSKDITDRVYSRYLQPSEKQWTKLETMSNQKLRKHVKSSRRLVIKIQVLDGKEYGRQRVIKEDVLLRFINSVDEDRVYHVNINDLGSHDEQEKDISLNTVKMLKRNKHVSPINQGETRSTRCSDCKNILVEGSKYFPRFLFGATFRNQYRITVMTHLNGDTLTEYLRKNKKFRLQHYVILEKALMTLWGTGTVHGDLHPSNIMMVKTIDIQGNEEYEPYIFDLGYALRFDVSPMSQTGVNKTTWKHPLTTLHQRWNEGYMNGEWAMFTKEAALNIRNKFIRARVFKTYFDWKLLESLQKILLYKVTNQELADMRCRECKRGIQSMKAAVKDRKWTG